MAVVDWPAPLLATHARVDMAHFRRHSLALTRMARHGMVASVASCAR